MTATVPQVPANAMQAAPQASQAPTPPPGTKTVTIIDGKTGARREIFVPLTNGDAASPGVNGKGARQ
jgi:hypothetical protein